MTLATALLGRAAARTLHYRAGHHFSFEAGHTRDGADGVTTVPWVVGGELRPERGVGYRLDSTVKAHPYITAHSNVSGPIIMQVSGTYERVDGWMTVFDFDGYVFSIHPTAVDVGPPGRQVLVGSFGSVSSTHKGASHVAHGFYLVPEHRGFAAWTPGQLATIEFPVNEDGSIEIPRVHGVPFEPVAFPFDPEWTPKPMPFTLGGGSKLVLGSTFSVPGWHSNFTGERFCPASLPRELNRSPQAQSRACPSDFKRRPRLLLGIL